LPYNFLLISESEPEIQFIIKTLMFMNKKKNYFMFHLKC